MRYGTRTSVSKLEQRDYEANFKALEQSSGYKVPTYNEFVSSIIDCMSTISKAELRTAIGDASQYYGVTRKKIRKDLGL